MTAASVISWAIDALIASALLIAVVLLARGPVRRAFGPQVAYALWALPLLRFCLPALPAGWWRHAAATPISRAGETITVLVVAPARAVAAAPAAFPWGQALALLWAAGAAAFLGWHALRHRRFCRHMLASAERVEEVNGVMVLTSAAAPGPLAFGIWQRYVAFPRDFGDRYDADERALALAHELGHHARRDLHANWAALVVLALHWFNPLAWRAFHAFRADQELANDARVLAGRSAVERHVYACAIVKAAHGGAFSAACHLHTIADLKGRLRMLATSRASRRRLAAGSAAVSLLIAGGLGATASSSQAAVALREGVGAALQVAPPAPPPPPAPVAEAVPAALPAPVAHAVKRVVVVKDGKTQTYEGTDADAYLAAHDMPVPPTPPVAPGAPTVVVRHYRSGHTADGKTWRIEVPQVSSASCPGDRDRPVVENSMRGGVHRIVVCTNRIEAMSRDAERLAAASIDTADIERHAMLSARTSLTTARAAIEHERNLTDDQRAQALAGIAQAEAELKDEGKPD